MRIIALVISLVIFTSSLAFADGMFNAGGVFNKGSSSGGGSGNVGIGTVNYVPIYTGTTTVGPSSIVSVSGNVGVSSVNPTQKLDVNGTTKTTHLIITANDLSIGYPTLNPSSMAIFNTNVGIGTNNVINRLDVNGAATIGTYYTTSAPANGLIVSGNVGIGSWIPGQALEVNGTVKATAFMKAGGTSSQFLKADGSIDSTAYSTSGSLWATQNTVDQSLAGGNVGIGTTFTTLSALTIMNGNVGIGTFAPAGKLDVGTGVSSARTTINGGSISINSGTTMGANGFASVGTAAGTVYTCNGNAITTGVCFSGSSTSTGVTTGDMFRVSMTGLNASGSGLNVGIGTQAASTGVLVVNQGTGYTARFNSALNDTAPTIIDATGNVGIGTTTANSPLTIKGSTITQKLTQANQACATTCGTFACYFGEDTGVLGTMLDCADASADVCFCSK